jgi:hypothetical protein
MEYTVKITEETVNYAEAEVVGLPDVYLHFGHLNFKTVWNKETGRHESLKGVDTFYGGNTGEGSAFETWQDAIHSSLYDAFQVHEEFKDGDTFVVLYRGESARFRCDGVHVVKA